MTPIGDKVELFGFAKRVLRDRHGEPQIFDVTSFIVLHLHQIFVELLVKSLQVVHLVTLVDHLVEEKLCEVALQENALVDGFADNYTEEFKVGSELGILLAREHVRKQGAVFLCLREEAVLGVEDLLSELRHELLEKTTAVDAVFHLEVAVDELDLEPTSRGNIAALDGIEGVLQDVVSSDLDGARVIPKAVLFFFL